MCLRRKAFFSLAALLVVPTITGAVEVRFDVGDNLGASPVQPGWVAVTGSSNDPKSLTGGDGVRTLVLSTSGDGQDRDRNAGSFPTDAAMWRDFWFVANSTVGGATATATLSGFSANARYTVEIWAFDFNSTGNRSATWTDAVTGNSATATFNGSGATAPASLADYVFTVVAQADGAGVIRLTGAAAIGGSAGLPNVFVNGVRVTDFDGVRLPIVEAESGVLGSNYTVTAVGGVTGIAPVANNTAFTPETAARVASYSVRFPAANIYQLYVRLQVGPGTFSDDSFFYASSFGAKNPANAADWVAVISGLVDTGFTSAAEQITVGGGSAGAQVWKWVKFGTFFTVNEGALTQTFQLGSREDGLYIDKFAFAPADVPLTVAELEAGLLPERPPTAIFEGVDGVALHRFDEPYKGTNYEGANSLSGLVFQAGRLWGLASGGGLQGAGTLYSLAPDGSDFDITNTLPAEIGPGRPRGMLTPGAGGIFYGVSQTGGTGGTGTVFRRQSTGLIEVLRNFTALSPHTGLNTGGALPAGTLLANGGRLYGAATLGGANGRGVLFSLTDTGADYTVLKEMEAVSPDSGHNSSGATPQGGMVMVGGRIYGVASEGGAGGAGVVYSLLPDGTGYTVLHHFAGPDANDGVNAGGAYPAGGLAEAGGRLYGVTMAGGAGGRGVIFSVATNGTEFSVLHAFSAFSADANINSDGGVPVARPLISGSLLYGATSAGGVEGGGTLFVLDTTRLGLRTLHAFAAPDANGLNARGAYPVAEVARVGDRIFGTTVAGGPGGTGVVYSVPLPLAIEIAATTLPGGGAEITVTGRGGPFSIYSIEATDDLSVPDSWQVVRSGEANTRGELVHVEAGMDAPRRFFRLVAQP